MRWPTGGRLTRIAVFIDRGYFDEVGRYYKFNHPYRARLSVNSIQEFIRHKVAQYEKTEEAFCQITKAHYFLGRFSTSDAVAAGKLEDQAAFNEILIRAGIIQHYMPIDCRQGIPQEKGIDVWLSLEAFDLAVH